MLALCFDIHDDGHSTLCTQKNYRATSLFLRVIRSLGFGVSLVPKKKNVCFDIFVSCF